jgi:hypothetical protein
MENQKPTEPYAFVMYDTKAGTHGRCKYCSVDQYLVAHWQVKLKSVHMSLSLIRDRPRMLSQGKASRRGLSSLPRHDFRAGLQKSGLVSALRNTYQSTSFARCGGHVCLYNDRECSEMNPESISTLNPWSPETSIAFLDQPSCSDLETCIHPFEPSPPSNPSYVPTYE